MQISREYSFDCAHLLPNHSGKCRRLHGHTYRMCVSVYANSTQVRPDESSEGMAMDFADLDHVVKTYITDKWDHRFLSAGDEWPYVYGSAGRQDEFVLLNVRTTAENLASLACLLVQNGLKVFGFQADNVIVQLWETPKSSALASTTDSRSWLKNHGGERAL